MSRLLRFSWVILAGLVVAQARADVTIEADVHDALAAGRARVVVELVLPRPFVPEGELSDALARRQREMIRAAQEDVLDALAGSDTRLTRRPTTIPFLALEIGPDALVTLSALPSTVSHILLEGTAAANPHAPSRGSQP